MNSRLAVVSVLPGAFRAAVSFAVVSSCSTTQEAPTTPEPEVVDFEPPAPPPPPPKVPPDAVAIGTFNLKWAFAPGEGRRPKAAFHHTAKTEEDWAWKRDRIAEILAEEELDVVALQELGGRRELDEIVQAIKDAGGYDYEPAFVESNDAFTGQHVAILSRYPVSDVRRYEVSLSKHVVADVRLPNDQSITVVAVHMREGQYGSQVRTRQQQAAALKRKVNVSREQRPVVVLGSINSNILPYDKTYGKRTPGLMAGANTPNTAEDDCFDASADMLMPGTTIYGDPFDRIFACGVPIRRATIAAVDRVVREQRDGDLPWPSVPIDAEPHRDVSDHFVLWAEIAMPQAPGSEAIAQR